jgi:hypothetical protein
MSQILKSIFKASVNYECKGAKKEQKITFVEPIAGDNKKKNSQSFKREESTNTNNKDLGNISKKTLFSKSETVNNDSSAILKKNYQVPALKRINPPLRSHPM